MAISEREHHIKVLEQFLHDYQEWGEDFELEKTIKYAISSLKTDLKYDLMYEGEDVYTKDEVIAMLEDLKADIEVKTNYYEQAYKEPSNLIHETAICGRMFGCGECKELIQQKIDKLEGNKQL